MSDDHSNGNGGSAKRATLTDIAEKHAENAVLRFLARWSMVAVVPGLLTVLVAVAIFAGGRLLAQFEKMADRLERMSERQELHASNASAMQAQIKMVTEVQLPTVTTILNDRMTAQADRIFRVEKLVDEEFKSLKLQDLKHNEKLEALLERLYKLRQVIQPQSGSPRINHDVVPSLVPGQL